MRNLVRAIAIAACALAAGPSVAEAAPRQARVAGVVDGDTIRVTQGGRSLEVDLLGVRAATGCGTDGVATLRWLLPRGSKVTLVRDGARRGAYVVRRSTFVNAELVAVGAAKAAGLRGLRRAARLRAAQRQARTLQLGVWSCAPEAAPPVPAGDATAGIDTPENRAELDRFIRGYRFTVREQMDGMQFESTAQFCTDGRLIAQFAVGLDRGSMEGTWKLLDVVRRDGELFLGRVAATFTYEGETETDEITMGRRADGTAVFESEGEQTTAARARADAC